MRTTLTLDDDVAVRLQRLRQARGGRLKDTVNDALRLGLRALEEGVERRGGTTASVDLGRPRVADVDDVSGILAAVEGDGFR